MPKLGQNKSVIYGLLLNTAGYVLFAFATKEWMMYAFRDTGAPFIAGSVLPVAGVFISSLSGRRLVLTK
jgi:hypothetical protein